MINNDLVKYEILAADDPFAALKVKVAEMKQSLETELNDDSWQKVSALNQIAKEMEQRNEALRLVLTTAIPIFEASNEEKIRDWALSFDLELKRLALEDIKEFELEGVLLDGTKINLKDYRGKVVLLNYWATWCGPCLGEIPQLKRLHEMEGGWVKTGKVELIGISVDEDLDALKNVIAKEQIQWRNISEKLSLEQNLPDSRKKYGIDAFPTVILIDQSGKVVRAGDLHSVIGEIRKLLPAEEGK